MTPQSVRIDGQEVAGFVDDDGFLEVESNPGEQAVIVTADGYESLRARHTSVAPQSTLNVYEMVRSRTTTTDSRAAVASGCTVSGWVRSAEDRRSIQSARVVFESSSVRKEITTDSDGRYCLSLPIGALAGDWRVHVEAAGREPREIAGRDNGDPAGGQVFVIPLRSSATEPPAHGRQVAILASSSGHVFVQSTGADFVPNSIRVGQGPWLQEQPIQACGGGYATCSAYFNACTGPVDVALIEPYVERVLTGELSGVSTIWNNAQIEAFKALAVAIRTYASYDSIYNQRGTQYDICNGPACQCYYSGLSSFGPTRDAASSQTAGQLLLNSSGHVVFSEYGNWNGPCDRGIMHCCLEPYPNVHSIYDWAIDNNWSLRCTARGFCNDPNHPDCGGHGRGLSQYGAHFRATSGNSYSDILSFYYGDYGFHLSSAPFTLTLARGLDLISFPFTPVGSNGSSTFADVFSPVSSDLFPFVFFINQDSSIGFGSASSVAIEPKRGYFVYMSAARQLSVTGQPATPDIPIHRGFNAIGVTSSQHLADPSLWDVGATLQGNTIGTVSLSRDYLQPGLGYFVYASAATSLSSVPAATSQNSTLRTSNSARLSASSAAAFTASIRIHQLNLTNQPNDLTLTSGLRSDATDGFDSGIDVLGDIPLPGSLNAFFDDGGFPLKTNYKSIADAKEWPFTVFSQSRGVNDSSDNLNPVTLSWTVPDTGSVDPAAKVELLDSSGNFVVPDMRTTTSTNFGVTAAATRADYRIRFTAASPSDATPPAVAITAPTANTKYLTTSTPVLLQGTASDNVGVTQVSCRNTSTGLVSVASGTTTWNCSVDLQVGSNPIVVTARDAANNSGAAQITMTFVPVVFMDDPIVVGTTPVKATHIAELRTAVNALRSGASLSPYQFSDSDLLGQPIRSSHIKELRSALGDVFTSFGLQQGSYTTSANFSDLIRAAEVSDLRNAVKFAASPSLWPVDFHWSMQTSQPEAMTRSAVVAYADDIFIFGANTFTRNYRFHPATNAWTVLADAPKGVSNGGAALVGTKAYVVGDPANTNVVQIYDIAGNSWTTGASMPTARTYFGLVAVNGKLYAIGGYGGAASAATEEYDPSTNAWAKRADMPTARYGASVAVVNNIIYVIGGATDGGILTRRVEAFDPIANSWYQREDALSCWQSTCNVAAPYLTATAVLNNRIYIIGGYDNYRGSDEAQVEEFDPAKPDGRFVPNAWSLKAPIGVARREAVAAVVNGNIYVIGGDASMLNWTTSSAPTSVEVGVPYNP